MNTYKLLTPEEQEELNSQFIISSWSYSKVSTFSRHQKAYEMAYIYGIYGKESPTSVAGKAYHKALEYYFTQAKDGVLIDMVELEASAFQFLEEQEARTWRLSKTCPTVEACMQKCLKTTGDLLRNFYAEKHVYDDDIAEILEVEVYVAEYLTINGVDIPLPCHMKIDMVVRTKRDTIAIVDHKSKNAYTSEEELQMTIGPQAITYAKGYEAKTGVKVDEVWFVENKYSKNKDGGNQLNPFKLKLTDDVRKLYEALLYEPLRAMIQAAKDPDYVYLINKDDNYVDQAELHDFWCRTMICEVEDFNVEETKKEMVAKRLKKIRDVSTASITPSVIKTFKEKASKFIQYDLSGKDMTPQQKIEHVLRSFSTIVNVAYEFQGYSSNTYLLEVSAGVKISSIYSHRLDIANALDVPNVRISKEMVIHEGRSYLAVEFVKKRDRNLFWDASALDGLKIPIGKDNFDKTIIWDLENHSTPHMLVCGASGQGKSVMLRSTIHFAIEAGVSEIIILDPKYEFTKYANQKGITVVNEILDIEIKMAELVEVMNHRVKSGQEKKTLVIFDEFADAVESSRQGKELHVYETVATISANGKIGEKREKTGELKSLEQNLRILSQKGRSIGFRIIAATQRASVKVITGDAKVNFPVQICFRVPKETDSRVVLGEPGAESLAGAGDGLMRSPEYSDTVRFQGFFYDEKKVPA